jgi:hypothetical protein
VSDMEFRSTEPSSGRGFGLVSDFPIDDLNE